MLIVAALLFMCGEGSVLMTRLLVAESLALGGSGLSRGCAQSLSRSSSRSSGLIIACAFAVIASDAVGVLCVALAALSAVREASIEATTLAILAKANAIRHMATTGDTLPISDASGDLYSVTAAVY
jgi:hypothetical protein